MIEHISHFFLQYAMDMMYEGVKASVYISSFVNGNKVNNYTMLVAKDNGAPLVLHFVGYDRLFGSHYDEYDVIYKTFSSSAPDPSVFDFQESKCYIRIYFSKPLRLLGNLGCVYTVAFCNESIQKYYRFYSVYTKMHAH